jgi:hypothetical protein
MPDNYTEYLFYVSQREGKQFKDYWQWRGE